MIVTSDGQQQRRLASLAFTEFLSLVGKACISLSERLQASWTTTTAAPLDPIQVARDIISRRRRRDALFGKSLFGEPAWDMLLDLFVAQSEGQTLSVSSLCVGSCVPTTTAMRWIYAMAAKGLVDRIPDRSDKRRMIVTLAPRTHELLTDVLSSPGPVRANDLPRPILRQAAGGAR